MVILHDVHEGYIIKGFPEKSQLAILAVPEVCWSFVVPNVKSKGATEKDWEDDRAYIEEAFRLGIDEVVVSPRIGDEHYERDMRRYAEIVGL